MKFDSDQSTLVAEIEKSVSRIARMWSEFLRTEGPISPTTLGELRLSRVRTYNEALLLHILVHYLKDENIQWVIKSELLDVQNRFSSEDKGILKILLKSKANMLLYIIESSEFKNPREFFGFLGSYQKEVRRFQLYRFKPKKVVKPQRVRGYRDHGSMKPLHKWLPSRSDILTQQQIEKEDRDQTIIDTLNFLEGGIT